ncbi:MAG: hypothetical protein RL211_1197 [Pseudomonadota bacterium]|jgi:hypothetical protein
MRTETAALNPFSLMMEPEMVRSTMELSQQLRDLRRHKLHPLDKPLIPYSKTAMRTRAAFNAETGPAFDAETVDDAINKYFHN